MASNCKSCGEPVIWALTQREKRMPVDVVPVVGGNIELEYNAPDGTALETPFATYVRKSDELRYVSHFATCVDADQHRKA